MRRKKKPKKKRTKTPREIRDELCSKVPPDPACTADGHARRATEFEKLFRPRAPAGFDLADGVFVDKAISKSVAAYVKKCTAFKPALEGDRCVFIPDRLEKQAARYNSGEKKIGGEDREEWFTDTLGTVTHELEHVRFRKQFPKTAPRPEACEFDDVSRELSELGANMSEFPVVFQAQANKSWHDRRVELDKWFKYKITQPPKHGETIAGILKAIRCRCECQDVNAYLERLVEFTTKSWTEVEKNTFHEELRDPKWKLDWPIKTPPPPRDLPSLLVTPSLSIGYGHSAAATCPRLQSGRGDTGRSSGEVAAAPRRSGAYPAPVDRRRSVHLHAWTQGGISPRRAARIARAAIWRVRRNRQRIISVGDAQLKRELTRLAAFRCAIAGAATG